MAASSMLEAYFILEEKVAELPFWQFVAVILATLLIIAKLVQVLQLRRVKTTTAQTVLQLTAQDFWARMLQSGWKQAEPLKGMACILEDVIGEQLANFEERLALLESAKSTTQDPLLMLLGRTEVQMLEQKLSKVEAQHVITAVALEMQRLREEVHQLKNKVAALEDHLESIGDVGFNQDANLTKEMGDLNNMIPDVAKDVLSPRPEAWNVANVQEKYPTLKEESMKIVPTQKINGFLKAIQGCIQKAAKGLRLMSANLRFAPMWLLWKMPAAMWLRPSNGTSLKPLGGSKDLVERLKFSNFMKYGPIGGKPWWNAGILHYASNRWPMQLAKANALG